MHMLQGINPQHNPEINPMSKIQLALETANAQLEMGWIEVDQDKYEWVETRLEMVASLIRSAERELAKMENQLTGARDGDFNQTTEA